MLGIILWFHRGYNGVLLIGVPLKSSGGVETINARLKKTNWWTKKFEQDLYAGLCYRRYQWPVKRLLFQPQIETAKAVYLTFKAFDGVFLLTKFWIFCSVFSDVFGTTDNIVGVPGLVYNTDHFFCSIFLREMLRNWFTFYFFNSLINLPQKWVEVNTRT